MGSKTTAKYKSYYEITKGSNRMFSINDIDLLRQSPYEVVRFNSHDVTLHSERTGHDWIIVSDYGRKDCYILHRHSPRDPYHQQRGRHNSLEAAMNYVKRHEKWVMRKRAWNGMKKSNCNTL